MGQLMFHIVTEQSNAIEQYDSHISIKYIFRAITNAILANMGQSEDTICLGQMPWSKLIQDMNSCANLRCLRDLPPPEHGFSRMAFFPQPSTSAIHQYIKRSLFPCHNPISYLSHICSPDCFTHFALALEHVVQERTEDFDSIPGAVILSTSMSR